MKSNMKCLTKTKKKLRTGKNVWSRARTTDKIWKRWGLQVETLVCVPLRLILYLDAYYFGFSWAKIKWCWPGIWLYTCWRSEKIYWMSFRIFTCLRLNFPDYLLPKGFYQLYCILNISTVSWRNAALNERFVMMICNESCFVSLLLEGYILASYSTSTNLWKDCQVILISQVS